MKRPRKNPPSNKRLSVTQLILAATGFAAGELALGIIAGFFHGGRAEILLFLAFRPWLLLLASALIGGYPLRQRAALITLGLLLASASELMLVLSLGAAQPWIPTLRGLLAGLLLALALEMIYSSGRDFIGRGGAITMTLPLVAIFLYPGGLKGYDVLALGTERRVEQGPELMLMTALPIVWGEGGAFDPQSRPAESYRALQAEFRVRPIDAINDTTLRGGRLLLLAQPRALSPQELVALDAWVRAGGRVLILTDPALSWPTKLPLGDLRRPPPVGLLSPLLGHWGLTVDAPAYRATIYADLDTGSARRRLALAAPGALTSASGACEVPQPWLARCRIGAGEAIVLADADLLRDDLWLGTGPNGAERHHRVSDNVASVGDLLDGLAGLDRSSDRGRVDWLPLQPNRLAALLAALLPLLLSTIFAALLRPRH